MKISRYLILSDIHVPHHCVAYIALSMKLVKMIRPDGIVQLGDALDFWQISRFDKDPQRKQTIVEDAKIYSAILQQWANLLKPDGIIHQLCGNHEDRLRRYIWQHARELDGLVKTVPEMIGLKQLGIATKWHELSNWQSCRIGDAILHHGHYYNQHVAMGNLTRYPKSLITGHTHRFQYVTNGERFSASLGHGSNESQTAHQPTPTGWQQAMGLLTVVNGKSTLEPIIVRNGKCILYGKEVSA